MDEPQAMTSVKLFYFGPWDQAGHYLHDQSHRRLWPDNDKIGPWRLGELDGGLQPKDEKQVEGVALLHHLDGWTALAFWDRTVDHRMASCSVYVATGTHSFEEMVALAQDGFKERWDRMKFEVRQSKDSR